MLSRSILFGPHVDIDPAARKHSHQHTGETAMTSKIVVGLEGGDHESSAIGFARKLSALIGDCELLLVYVIEWSPYSFQTPEENAERHKRREAEIAQATERVVTPAVEQLKKQGLKVRGIVRHGNVADVLERTATEENADQIVISRTSKHSLTDRIFGSSTANLVMHASVPVTVVA
jgi:nucleotide-binding universal stress UspA family protein